MDWEGLYLDAQARSNKKSYLLGFVEATLRLALRETDPEARRSLVAAALGHIEEGTR
jgi:hypothetical protein